MTKSQKRRRPAEKRQEYNPVTVPFAVTPAGETLGIDQWAHRAVWTDRMLATLLEDKVKGGKWHTLIDKTRNQRWPNTYFTERGFISLNATHARFVQSLPGTY